MPMTKCPAGCGRDIMSGHLLCGPCWHALPADLQRDVMRTWRRRLIVRGERTSTLAERRAAMDAHHAAVDAALEWL